MARYAHLAADVEFIPQPMVVRRGCGVGIHGAAELQRQLRWSPPPSSSALLIATSFMANRHSWHSTNHLRCTTPGLQRRDGGPCLEVMLLNTGLLHSSHD